VRSTGSTRRGADNIRLGLAEPFMSGANETHSVGRNERLEAQIDHQDRERRPNTVLSRQLSKERGTGTSLP
jgi:hypothetical protein